MTTQPDLPGLEQQRARLHAELATVGGFRLGPCRRVMRRCRRPSCAYSDPAHPGHVAAAHPDQEGSRQDSIGAYQAGRGAGEGGRRGGQLQAVRQIVGEIMEVNEVICGARPALPLGW